MKTEKQVDISRRSFLKGGGMAAGGLLATAALPALADDPSVFPNRGGWERLSLQFFEIKAGANKINRTYFRFVYANKITVL